MGMAALLTVLIETPLMYLFGLRSKDALIVVIAANIATNVSLNLALGSFGMTPLLTAALEISAVLIEYALYRPVAGDARLLFLKTLAANAASFCAGLLLMPLF
ncbi:MAG: hypothetical protein IJM17_08740 [Firmicutes bacterium]|nr:hypothetical protein [Bacillota bacterium]